MALQNDSMDVESLARAAEAARGELMEAIAALRPDQLAADAFVGEWGVREIVAHLGYWAGNVAEALHHAEQGRAEQFGAGEESVDERNRVVARVARESDLATARRREEGAFAALLDRLRRADPAWLAVPLADGETIGHLVQEDGVDHYRDHARDLRRAADAGR